MRAASLLVAAALLAAAVPARAQDDAPAQPLVGSGLTFTGVPTVQELYAQQKACEARKPPRKAKGAISESTYKRMERIIDAIGKGEYAESEKKLTELNENARGDYEKAIILQTLGFVYASQSKEAQAIKTFEAALATNALPQQVHEQMMLNIAQLYIADNKYDRGMEHLNVYLQESCNPNPDAHILLASAYAEKKRFREALKQVDLALVKAKTPKEQWLQLKLALHYELKEFPRCAEVLVHLVGMNPVKEEYFKQLQGILFEIKKDPESLAVLGLADRRGYINEEAEYRNLSNLYMYMGIPFKAGVVLQRGLDAKQVEPTEKNLEMLANAWMSARENDKAEAVLKKAAAISEKGELYRQLGYIYSEKMQWKDAIDALEKALRKGNVKEPGDLQLLIAQAAIELKQWKRAEEAVRAAMGYEKTSKIATEWAAHVQAEYDYATRDKNPVEPADPLETQTN
ncbi:MAG TPA: hypothetical protein VM240_06100 [Verrucomicrobiae bacterium]|nr:hypothetical protein [Verrucomicrobiae bacterium]